MFKLFNFIFFISIHLQLTLAHTERLQIVLKQIQLVSAMLNTLNVSAVSNKSNRVRVCVFVLSFVQMTYYGP